MSHLVSPKVWYLSQPPRSPLPTMTFFARNRMMSFHSLSQHDLAFLDIMNQEVTLDDGSIQLAVTFVGKSFFPYNNDAIYGRIASSSRCNSYSLPILYEASFAQVVLPEERPPIVETVTLETPVVISLHYYSRFTSPFEFAKYFRGTIKPAPSPETAGKCCVEDAQPDCCQLLISSLCNKRELPSRNSLIRYSPPLDLDNVLRVGGRLVRSKLPFDYKHLLLIYITVSLVLWPSPASLLKIVRMLILTRWECRSRAPSTINFQVCMAVCIRVILPRLF